VKRKHLIIGGVVLVVLVVLGLLLPQFIEWFVGGTLAGGAALAGAQKRRRSANLDHQRTIDAERSDVEGLQSASDKLVEDATVRASTDPQEGAEGLSEEERRARLEEVARRLQ
jgi:hypothetical protein